MADAGFFKGTSTDQDRRFSDKELKLLKTMKFPSEFDKKVDMRKVNLQVIRPWITKKVVELVGIEDEVVVEYAMGLLEDESKPTPDPKKMQINLTGFLTSSTPAFMTALWKLLIEAQDSPAGIPRSFVEEKKAEMRNANRGDERVLEERERRRLDELRERERGQRGRDDGFGGRGRGRGRGRGGWEESRRGRDSGWGGRGGGRPPRHSRTPPRRPSPSYSRSPPRRQRHSFTPIRSSRSRSRSRSFSRSPPPPRRRRTPDSSPTPPLRGVRGSPPVRARDNARIRDRPRSLTPPMRGGPPLSRHRSRSRSLPIRDRDRMRDRARSPTARPHRSRSRSRTRSRSPRSPPPRHRDRDRRRSPPPYRRRRRSPSRSPIRSGDDIAERPVKRQRRSPSAASTVSGGHRERDRGGSKRLIDRMDVDMERDAGGRRTRWEERMESSNPKQDLTKIENELKEKALRQKVARTRDRKRSPSGERD